MRDAIKSALILGTVGAGGALVISGITGWKIPIIETGEAAIAKQIVEGDIVINRMPVAYDSTTQKYTIWERNKAFPFARTSKLMLPKDQNYNVQVLIEKPGASDKFEDAESIQLRIRNLGSSTAPVSYVSVVAVEFPSNPEAYPKEWRWSFTRPLQGVPSIPGNKDLVMTLYDRYWAGPKKGASLGMQDALEGPLGGDFHNIGLSVTLYSDWRGSKVVATERTMTRMNQFMAKAVKEQETEVVNVARVFMAKK